MPDGLRIESGAAAGAFAVVGEGLAGGDVAIDSGGRSVAITATIGESDEIPRELHIYTAGSPIASDAEISVRVARGSDRAGISRAVRTVVHLQKVPDGTLLRRNGEPLPRSGNEKAEVSNQAGSLVISTFTDDEATLQISSNTNPGFLDRAQWQTDRLLGSLPIPDVPVLGIAPAVGIAIPISRRRFLEGYL